MPKTPADHASDIRQRRAELLAEVALLDKALVALDGRSRKQRKRTPDPLGEMDSRRRDGRRSRRTVAA